MISRIAAALVLLATLNAFAPRVAAQSVPKVGGRIYEDKAVLGFSIKVPDDWDFVPPTPSELNQIGKYTQGSLGILRNPKNGSPSWKRTWC